MAGEHKDPPPTPWWEGERDPDVTRGLRAQMLRLLWLRGSPSSDGSMPGDGFLSDQQRALCKQPDREAHRLYAAVEEAQREHRRRQWEGLEAVLALLPPDLDYLTIHERTEYLNDDEYADLLAAARRCGWDLRPPPDPGDADA